MVAVGVAVAVVVVVVVVVGVAVAVAVAVAVVVAVAVGVAVAVVVAVSLTITTDVFCDVVADDGPCEGWIFGTTSHKTEAKEARRRAASAGWTRRRVDGKWIDLCPEHSDPDARRR